MSTTSLCKARLVYDGREQAPFVPPEMGAPRADQLQGTPREATAELAGRVCYDSLNTGRDSAGFHAHIHEVKHYSVYEHTPFTVRLGFHEPSRLTMVLLALANRPGVYVWLDEIDREYGCALRVTCNFRAIIEWDQWPFPQETVHPDTSIFLRSVLRVLGHQLAPRIVRMVPDDEELAGHWLRSPQIRDGLSMPRASLVDPKFPEEQWVTLFLSGSRGWSHEQVRHGDFSAISQRSTRFVDESESPWVRHPLVEAYCKDKGINPEAFERVDTEIGPDNPPQVHVPSVARQLYDDAVAQLQPWLIARGVDKFTARKQARGAARGYLGNALLTEMLFSASVAQWGRMIAQRATIHADAEIRQVFADPACGVIAALKQSQYGEAFACYDLQPSPDGLGHVAVKREPSA